MAIDVEKLEAKLDRAVVASTVIDMSVGGIKFQHYAELVEYARFMSMSGAAVPPHCRGNIGMCLAIATKALRFNFDPYSLAEHSYVMVKNQKINDSWVAIETVAYDSTVIHGIIEAHAPIKGRLRPVYEGEGDALICICSGTPKNETEPLIHKSPTLGAIKAARGTNDKGVLKGSPLWLSKPEQQIWYDTCRDWCRKYYPEILMGFPAKDDFDRDGAIDVTPTVATPTVGDRLRERKDKKASGEGFNTPKITQQMSEVAPDKIVQRETVVVENRAAKGEASGDEAPRETVTERDTPERSGTAREAPSDHQGTQSAARFSSDDPSIAIMQEAQSGSVATVAAQPDKTPAKRSKRAPVAEAKPVEETPLQRGTRLLPMQGDKQAVEDLQQSIAQELGSAESEQWIAACEARIGELK